MGEFCSLRRVTGTIISVSHRVGFEHVLSLHKLVCGANCSTENTGVLVEGMII